MMHGLANPAHKGGFRLINEFGAATAKVTELHEKAREEVYAHICEILKAGKAIERDRFMKRNQELILGLVV